MNLQQQVLAIETKAKLSALWIVFLLNIIFRDIHEFVEPGFIQEIMTGTLNGNPIQEHMLLVGGIMIEVPIAMICLSRLLPYRVNRWTNIIAATLYIAIAIAANGNPDLDDTFHLIGEVAALSFIIWSAWRWRTPSTQSTTQHQQTSAMSTVVYESTTQHE